MSFVNSQQVIQALKEHDEWKNKEDDGILYVPKAGEILYRMKL